MVDCFADSKFNQQLKMKLRLLAFLIFTFSTLGAEPVSISGVYPSLTMYNREGECGTGAVVPWAGRLWVITYGPHLPMGSSDKLYEITPCLEQIIRPESIGGTPANRMIHKESQQLVIGPYFIDDQRNVRAIPYQTMPGRHTGTARHLDDSANKVYIATMEEGLYSINVKDLSVTEHIRDGNGNKGFVSKGINSTLPGYHGKGLYTGQGNLVYANNGAHGKNVRTDPTTTSGALAKWQGSGDWQLVRRNQFTEVTGPGGIYGNQNEEDPVWAMGWDARSLILMLLDGGEWHPYRLPKGSHSYDGAHGWNTEWPRIRDIGEEDLLATMHGTFWRFPKHFSKENSAGIAPRSNYLKVIGDFALWQGKLVLGCDDSAQKEFLNHRPFKSFKGAPTQSNSNLWFVEPEQVDNLGPAIGRGSVWLRDDLEAGQVSEPYLFSGYDHRMMVIHHDSTDPVQFTLEVDKKGNGKWTKLETFKVAGSLVHIFPENQKGAWVRARVDKAVEKASVHFHYRDKDARSESNDPIFEGIPGLGMNVSSKGILRSNSQVLGMLAEGGYYELNKELELKPKLDPAGADVVAEGAPIKTSIRIDEASAIVEEDGQGYRIPVSHGYEAGPTPKDEPENKKTLEELLTQNLAKGAKVTVDKTHAGFVGENAVDGVFIDDSRWIANGAATLQLDLGEEKTFKSVYVITGWQKDPQFAARNFDIQVKQGGQWKTLPQGEVRENGGIVTAILLDKAVTAQELQILFTDNGYNRVYEVALFSDHPDIATSSTANPQQVRVCREVATERDLFNFRGTLYELPARNAQGFAKIRPIATHNLNIHDYASHFGLLFMTGLNGKKGEHIINSSDGNVEVWAGVIDDLWKLGKPRGEGGVWRKTKVAAGETSLPYLMTGYDKKSAKLSATQPTTISLEIDIDGTGLWVPYKSFQVGPESFVKHDFPEGFSAYWIRAISDSATTATVTFRYE